MARTSTDDLGMLLDYADALHLLVVDVQHSAQLSNKQTGQRRVLLRCVFTMATLFALWSLAVSLPFSRVEA